MVITSPEEATIYCYKNPGGNNNSDDIRTVVAPDGKCFVENNWRRILNKWNVPVRREEKGLLYPFSKHNPSYLSKIFSISMVVSSTAPPLIMEKICVP